MCNCDNNSFDIFTIDVKITVKLQSFVYADGTIEYRAEHESLDSIEEREIAIKSELIKRAVHAKYGKSLQFLKFDTFSNGTFAHFYDSRPGDQQGFVYFYGYFARTRRDTCSHLCDNAVPQFIIVEKHRDTNGCPAPDGFGECLHPAKCEWFTPRAVCSCDYEEK